MRVLAFLFLVVAGAARADVLAVSNRCPFPVAVVVWCAPGAGKTYVDRDSGSNRVEMVVAPGGFSSVEFENGYGYVHVRWGDSMEYSSQLFDGDAAGKSFSVVTRYEDLTVRANFWLFASAPTGSGSSALPLVLSFCCGLWFFRQLLTPLSRA